MTNDLFLQWLGERTRGSWELFKAAHTWLFAQNSAMNRNLRPTWTAYLLASLGHIEVDWRDGKWSVAAPTIAGLPSAGATAVLIGARPRILVERFDRYTRRADVDLRPVRICRGGDGARGENRRRFRARTGAASQHAAAFLGIPCRFRSDCYRTTKRLQRGMA